MFCLVHESTPSSKVFASEDTCGQGRDVPSPINHQSGNGGIFRKKA
jgi:hypothetical protein